MPGQTEPKRVLGDRYRLVQELGAGGFGRVWQARDEQLGVDVAVKEVWLPPAMSVAEHQERLARAHREARNAAALRGHPNIVAVHDVLTVDDRPWIVMDLVHGQSLEQRISQQGRLSSAVAASVATALLDALSAAHDAGITHRDVKPANVLLDDNGRVLLTDFGIAEHNADTGLTATGAIVGSLEYTAPERLDGKGASPSSDLFSLGATLYHAVEGASAFHRDTPTATITAILTRDPSPPTHAGRLTTLITRLLDKNPATRPDIAEARRLLDSPTTREPAPKPATRRESAPIETKPAGPRSAANQAAKKASPRKNAISIIAGLALIVLAIIIVPRLGDIGKPAGCGAVNSALDRYDQAIQGTSDFNTLATADYRLSADLNAAAPKVTDPKIRSDVQEEADASKALGNFTLSVLTHNTQGETDFNENWDKYNDARGGLHAECKE